jgi:hypothetical protein
MRRFLRPLPVALGLIAVLGAIALAKTASPAYRARVDALHAEAAAQRQKLHLDAKAACAKDPTPEVRFAKVLQVQPGKAFHLRIPGRFDGKVTPVFESDAIQVTRAAVAQGALEIDGKVAADALPAKVHLSLIRALCPLTVGADALEIVGRTRWEVAFPAGWRLGMVCGPPAEDRSNCQSTWTGKDTHQEMRATLEPRGDGRYRVRYHLNPQQIAAAQKATERVMQGPSPELTARMQKAQAALGTCEQKPQSKQLACIQAHVPALEKASAEYNAAMQHLAGAPGPALIGCDSAELEIVDGKVSAEGDTCGEQGPKLQNGHGTVQILP